MKNKNKQTNKPHKNPDEKLGRRCPVRGTELISISIQSCLHLQFREETANQQSEATIGVEIFREEATRRPVFTSGCKRIFASLPLGAEEDKQTDSHPQYPTESTVLKAPREKQACQNVKEIQKALAQPIPNHSEPNSAEMRCFSKTISG